MAGSRGQKCSWKEMQRVCKEVLPAIQNGQGKRYAEYRCVNPSTVTTWSRTSEVVDVLVESGIDLGQFNHFAPTHARHISQEFRRLKEKPWSDDTKGAIIECVDACESEELTAQQAKARANAAVKALRPEVATAESASGVVESLVDLAATGQRFSCIYADPPWRYGNQGTRAAAGKHYATMTVEQICAEPVGDVVADKAHLHLWTTNAFLFDAKTVLEAWGFEYKSVFVWVKPQLGIGNYWRVGHEFMLLGIRGKEPFVNSNYKSWMELPRTKHSQKPWQVRELVGKVSPGPYLEMYGRQAVSGWTVYGNEVEKGLFT